MKDKLLLIAAGYGLAALTLTEQGKKITEAVMGGKVLPALGEGGSTGGDKTDASEMKKSDEDSDFPKKEKDED